MPINYDIEYPKLQRLACDRLVEIESLRTENSKWKERCESLANFNPDWDMLEATQESLLEHMQTIRKLEQKLHLTEQAMDSYMAEAANLREVIAGMEGT